MPGTAGMIPLSLDEDVPFQSRALLNLVYEPGECCICKQSLQKREKVLIVYFSRLVISK